MSRLISAKSQRRINRGLSIKPAREDQAMGRLRNAARDGHNRALLNAGSRSPVCAVKPLGFWATAVLEAPAASWFDRYELLTPVFEEARGGIGAQAKAN